MSADHATIEENLEGKYDGSNSVFAVLPIELGLASATDEEPEKPLESNNCISQPCLLQSAGTQSSQVNISSR